MPARKMRPFIPEVVDLPDRTVAVVRTTGDPNEMGARAFQALYGAVYPLKFARKKAGADFPMEPPRARWFAGPEWESIPKAEWTAAWALPVPDDAADLVQKDPEIPVVVETWTYGRIAQVLYVGEYAEEKATIDALHAFIAAEGLEIAGPHEEEYLSRPGATAPKTIIRYQVRPRA